MDSLRVRFAIGFSVLYTLFLGTALLIVYYSYADFRTDEFYNRLRDRALTTFRLMVEVEQIDSAMIQLVDRNTLNSLYDEKVLIFENGRLIYSSIDDKQISYDFTLLQKAKSNGEVRTTQGDDELLGISFVQHGKQYTLLALSFDKYGRRKMVHMKWLMLIVYIAGLGVGWTVTYLFVKRVIRPLEELKKNISQVHSDNLSVRLAEKGQGAEVDSLAADFNEMLERLRKSFQFQKDFVYYASHELRTPLTAMIGITENAMAENGDAGRLMTALQSLYTQQHRVVSITHSLLVLAKGSGNRQSDFPQVRIDDLLFRAAEILQGQLPESSIIINIPDSPQQEELFYVHADETLMLIAFNNLLKNGLQYSPDDTILVDLLFSGKEKEIEFKNRGGRLSAEEQFRIFDPFFRGINAEGKKGYGLGLSLIVQIADVHHAKIGYARKGEYNVFAFTFC